MGIGIEIRAGYPGGEDECKENLRAFFEREESIVPGRRISIIEYRSGMQADLFFAEENVYFMFDNEDAALVISAKTNSAGPGYHAYLVDLFGKLKTSLSLTWDEEDVIDESEYWHHRDFGDLQAAMGGWLGSLASHLVSNFMDGDVSGLALSMDADKVPDNDEHYAAHLLGWRERDFFTEIALHGITPEDCASFFIWWDNQADARMHLQCALAMMWCECNWLSPVTDAEKTLFTATFLCLERAWDEADIATFPVAAFPVAEWKEMAALSQSTEIAAELQSRFPGFVSSEPKIGYLRGPVRRHPGSGWRFTAPGMLHEDIEEDGTVLVYWNAHLTIRVSRFTVKGEELTAASLLAPLTDGAEGAKDFPLPDQKDIFAKVCHEPYPRKNENDYFCSHLFAAVDSGQVLHISVCYDDQSLRAEAEGIFASLSWQEN